MDLAIKTNDVLKMEKSSDKFFITLADNTYGIRFIGFKIRDCENGKIFHEFRAQNIYQLDIFAEIELEYYFPQDILKSKIIGTNLTFVVGNNPVKNLDFIERHYIYDILVGNYTFNFPFFMPNSENNIEFIYNVPTLPQQAKEDMANGRDIPAKSDTFIFVEGKLIIHRRANYLYKPRII